MKRAGAYVRISDDRTGEAEGVERQVEDTVALIEAHPDLTLAAEPFVDNDLSAHTGDERPRYEALMAAVRRGEIDTIVCWMQSRIWRNRRERAEAIEELARLRIRIVAVKGADLDLSTAAGRMVAGLVGEMDSFESEVKSERVARAARQRAEKGRPNGGTRRYGFTAKGQEIIPEEADIIRECARRVIAGENLSAVTHWLNDSDVPPVKAARWERTSLRNVLLSPAVAGRRHYKGVDVGPARWGPILDEATWSALRGTLTTEKAAPGSNTAKYLLAGLARCGLCGSRLWSHASRAGNGTMYRAYTCLPRSEGGCRGVSRSIERTDRRVELAIVRRLEAPDVRLRLLSQDTPDAAEVVQVERDVDAVTQRLIAIAEEFADRTDEIGRAQFRAADTRLRANLDGLLQRRSELANRSAFGDLVGVEDIAAHWSNGMLLPARRRLIRALVDVVVQPAGRSPEWRPELVEMRWRQLGG